MTTTISYRVQKSAQHPHIEWIELAGDGVLHECAVLKRDGFGNVYYFKTNSLDNIDKQRLAAILSDRNANNFELWDLMSHRTLGNGVNALAYFHQLVRVLTPNGKTVDPRQGQIGVSGTPTAPVTPGTVTPPAA
jgi:hypothetical protein